jgi:2-polyprenyl-6-hydroxyphenyl methylase/3-demethylubiquinone-9 3-methyltransferase
MTESAVNVDASELAKFNKLASRWWDPNGESRPLHEINPARLAYVAARMQLKGARVLDLGCGGGLLSEALAAAGADVVGIDMGSEVIDVARLHLLQSGLKVDYRECSAEQLAAELSSNKAAQAFDAITCMEMLEHVPEPAAILAACARMLKPGGKLFLSTLNRTPQAFAVAIVGAEYIARLLPRGTHSYARFIKPSELAAWLRDAGFELRDVSGLQYNPLTRRARVGGSPAVNYLAYAQLSM